VGTGGCEAEGKREAGVPGVKDGEKPGNIDGEGSRTRLDPWI